MINALYIDYLVTEQDGVRGGGGVRTCAVTPIKGVSVVPVSAVLAVYTGVVGGALGTLRCVVRTVAVAVALTGWR